MASNGEINSAFHAFLAGIGRDGMDEEFNKQHQSKNSVLRTGLLRAVIKANDASFLSPRAT